MPPYYKNSFQSTKEAVLAMLRDTEMPGNKLPAETELAKRMRVSVVTLRQALTALEAEGYITKKQGIGSFIHNHALDAYMRSDMGEDMLDLAASTGGKVEVRCKSIYVLDSVPVFQKELQLKKNEAIVVFEQQYYSDGKLFVMARNYIPQKLMNRMPQKDEGPISIDYFMWEYCGRELTYELTTWMAGLTPADLAKDFGTEANAPMLLWHQTVYDITDTAVCGIEVFFSPAFDSPRELRKWNFYPDKYPE